MNFAVNKYLSAGLLLNETITWMRPYNIGLDKLTIHTNFPDFETLYVVCIAVFFTLCLKLIKLFSTKKKKGSLGNRSLSEIQYLQDIVMEVHYAACYCGGESKLIRRCKLLLDMYPAACNVPMHGHNYTPFLRACWNGCAELISYMIRIGANIKATTDAGEGAVYLATYSAIRKKTNDFAAIKILLAAGADVNAAREDGLTSMELAVLKGHRRLACWLLAHGACAPGIQQTNRMSC